MRLPKMVGHLEVSIEGRTKAVLRPWEKFCWPNTWHDVDERDKDGQGLEPLAGCAVHVVFLMRASRAIIYDAAKDLLRIGSKDATHDREPWRCVSEQRMIQCGVGGQRHACPKAHIIASHAAPHHLIEPKVVLNIDKTELKTGPTCCCCCICWPCQDGDDDTLFAQGTGSSVFKKRSGKVTWAFTGPGVARVKDLDDPMGSASGDKVVKCF